MRNWGLVLNLGCKELWLGLELALGLGLELGLSYSGLGVMVGESWGWVGIRVGVRLGCRYKGSSSSQRREVLFPSTSGPSTPGP